ncbi:MAG TPA: vWA domain-containing protein [Leptospiraceae bacterium]|nr:vWA domain-containing protein [Leptospiraceae bacterium]HMY66841.1 vWA domain-containing protein [Leptospiraceae bacterium]HNF12766.1 vWA domain-containing protein [Leptospiraceae bacterium]HNF23239.1 vWA domain-containing protein [Leptospiraceae bacterium]HNI97125.1 vWA domain-containing protein [Leptospiraceae bacterium]
MQVVYSSTCPASLGIGVSTTPNYSTTEAVLSGFLDGSNVSCGTVTKDTKTDSLTGASDPKADFVWVVDNSGSMSAAQTAVSSAASAFFTALGTKKLDYRIGVITTDSSTLRTAGGTNWVTSSTANGQTVFTSNTSAGTSGSGQESATHFATQGINNGNLTPRSGSKLFFVFVSDEGDNWDYYNGTGVTCSDPTVSPWYPCTGGTVTNPFNTSSNVFTQNGYKVYSVIGLDSSTGKSGPCNANATYNGCAAGSTVCAYNRNNGYVQYYNLSTATGGSSASICSSDFSPIMTSIVSQAAGSASPYKLSKTPISSTIVVKVKGVQINNSTSNGWVYDATANAISFAGAATPAAGDAVTVTYEYNTSATAMSSGSNQTLTAFIGNASSEEVGKFAFGALLLAGIALAGRSFFSRKK